MDKRHNLGLIFRKEIGQASVEYVLTLTGVFLAMSGTAALFGKWIRGCFDLLVPFLQNAFFQ
jgi:Flp pilus assembly pilin Flp